MTQTNLIIRNSVKFRNKVKRLCQPLMETFGVADFWYAKTTPEGLHSTFETHIDYLDSYFSNDLYCNSQVFRDPGQFAKGFYLYNNFAEKHEHAGFNELATKLNNIPHSMYVLKCTEEEFVRFGIGTNPTQTSKNDFLINNMGLLRDFFHYFYKEAFEIIREADECTIDLKVGLGNNFRYIVQDETDKNVEKCRFLSTIYGVDFRDIQKLSSREIECLMHLHFGLTSVEIGYKMYISQRTVESHLVNIKNKLNCSSKSELFRFTTVLEKAGYFEIY